MIHIGLCADEKFALPFGVCLTSIFESNKDIDFTVHVITQEFKDDTLKKIKETETKYGKVGSVKLYAITDNTFSNYPISTQFPKSIYFRYLYAALLPETIEKIIYIDCDTVVLSNLLSLWNTDLSDNYILGAVEDRNSDDITIRNRIRRWDGKYYNSGVLLMNLKTWRMHKVFDKLADFILKNPDICVYPDQDAINIVFPEKIKELPYQYNFLMSFIAPFDTYRLHLSKKSKVEESFKNLVIVHFAAETKPWFRDSVHPMLFFWRYFYNHSVWNKVRLRHRKSLIHRLISKLIISILYPGKSSAVNLNMVERLKIYEHEFHS